MKRRMSDTVLAYIAGIIDGEGSININHAHQHKGANYFMLRLSVANTNKGLIDWLKLMTGGHVNTRCLYDGSRRAWQWYLSGEDVVELLTLVYPYLLVKRPQAELALSFQGNKREREPNWDNDPITWAERAVIDEAAYTLMHDLNYKGERT